MNRRCIALTSLMLVVMFGFLAPTAYAYEGKKTKGHEYAYDSKKAKGHQKDLGGGVFYNKAYFLIKNKEELGLSDKQVKKIKDLKLKAKKDLITREGEIEILALDIKGQMYEETIDTKAISELIDKKYELERAKSKSSVEAYVALKNILTKKQNKQLKSLYKKSKKEKGSYK